MNFLPFTITAYAFNAGGVLIDKILLNKSLPNPLTYTFFIALLQFTTILLLPFGAKVELQGWTHLALVSGLVWIFAIYTLFVGLKVNEASVAGPTVGASNPLFSIILGGLLLNQTLSLNQYLAFTLLLLGALLLTLNHWSKKLQMDIKLIWPLLSGFFFAVHYIILRQAFLEGAFLDVLIVNRLGAAFLILPLLLIPNWRKQIFTSRHHSQGITSKTTLIMFVSGQLMAAFSGFLLTYGVSLANPGIVNSLFGVQYLVILIVSLLLAKKHPHLLEENLSKSVIVQKIAGAVVLSIGLYLLSR